MNTGLLQSPISNGMLAVFWGGLVCGVLDLTSAIGGYGLRGVPPIRILQSVAAGALGRDSFNGGTRTAALGVFFHFFIAFSAAAVFYFASRKITFLTAHPVISGVLYGELVFLFMHFIVIPLSASPRGPVKVTWAFLIAGPLGHPFLVGLPIAIAVSWFTKRAA